MTDIETKIEVEAQEFNEELTDEALDRREAFAPCVGPTHGPWSGTSGPVTIDVGR